MPVCFAVSIFTSYEREIHKIQLWFCVLTEFALCFNNISIGMKFSSNFTNSSPHWHKTCSVLNLLLEMLWTAFFGRDRYGLKCTLKDFSVSSTNQNLLIVFCCACGLSHTSRTRHYLHCTHDLKRVNCCYNNIVYHFMGYGVHAALGLCFSLCYYEIVYASILCDCYDDARPKHETSATHSCGMTKKSATIWLCTVFVQQCYCVHSNRLYMEWIGLMRSHHPFWPFSVNFFRFK